MLSGGIKGEPVPPDTYDKDRYNLQRSIVELASAKTSIVKAPAGLGKTLIGILWARIHKKRTIWVCPRNAVADAVYENIIRELTALNLSCSVELYRTGCRQKTNVNDGRPEFNSDIIVTNIDTIMSPMVNNRVADRLFPVFGSITVMDEFHEFMSDAPLFASFIVYMRARHRLISDSHTLLLSATPSVINVLWDTDEKKTLILPDNLNHYPAQHNGSYQIAFSDRFPDSAVPGSLLVCNSVHQAQENFKKGYKHIIHHKYTEKDRKTKETIIYALFGKNKHGIEYGESLSSALVVQAAMDISFKELYDSVCSPESTLQRIGRTDRWGTFQDMSPKITFIQPEGDKSESGAVRTVYDLELQKE